MANSKEDAYLEAAENMFVYQNMTREEIAGKLQLSDKTVRVWAKKYNWAEKKAALKECKRNTHLDLYAILQLLTQKLKDDLAAGKDVSDHRVTALDKLTKTVTGLKIFEDKIGAEEKAEAAAAEVPDGDALVNKVNEILGVR